ncbi:MAG TPA: helix-hairpin-helix domain-containing protein [Terriglobales bacterium]|jgi:DNA uptake protein ComE-like DNA-binding protein|nr:helix-hairpin-helix domain-containing protein [Terriglobales bacterium]
MKKVLGVIASGLLAAAAGYGAILAYRRVRPERRDGKREQGELLDLNTCSREELAKLPGIRPDVLDRVIENRPYRNKLDLVSRLVLPQFEYEQMSHLVVVRDREEPVKVA